MNFRTFLGTHRAAGVLAYFFTAALLAGCAADAPADTQAWTDEPQVLADGASALTKYETSGMQLLDVLNTKFYDASRKLYVGSINGSTLERSGPSAIWPAAHMIRALNWGAMIDSKYDARLKSYVGAMDWYVNGEGYGAVHNGQRFFDDNALIGYVFMDVYQKHLRSQEVLDKSLFALKYVLKYRDANWGLPQVEPDLGDGIFYVGAVNPLSNAYAIYYDMTKDSNHFNIAKTYWNKFNDYDMKLKDSATKLVRATTTYADGVWTPSPGSRAANTAQVVSLGLRLYAVTGDVKYLNDAREMANAVLDRWYTPNGGLAEVSFWGGNATVEMLCDLYVVDGDERWYNIAKDIVDFLIDNGRDKGGFYPTGADDDGRWNAVRTGTNPPAEVTMMSQATAAHAILRFAYVSRNKNFVRLESKAHARLVQAHPIADGTGVGNNVQAVTTNFSADRTQWRFVPVVSEPGYFRIENKALGLWLQCTTVVDATSGRPDPIVDADTLAVRAVDSTNTGGQTLWRKVSAGDGHFHLQNRFSGYYLQVTTIMDVDGAGADGGTQVRAVPSSKAGDATRFREASY